MIKKYTFLFVIFALVLAGMACNLPYRRQAEEVPAVTALSAGYREEKRLVEDGTITLYVPDSYYVGGSIAELADLVEELDVIDTDLRGILGSTQADVLVWGYDADTAAVIPTSFVVIKNETYAAMPLGLISSLAGPIIGYNVEILQETRLTIAGRDTLRWITLTNEAGLELTQVAYVFKESGVLYLVAFNADQQEVTGQLSNYDAIVASLRVEDLE
ncbi:MAG: hypothetical protein GX142_04925 [Chloroflexi bacterium]|nr:hypothetical protein [Chloroflexota bacterium]